MTTSCASSNPDQIQAATELQRRRKARQSLEDFTTYTKPNYEVNWHHRVFFRYLDRVVTGDVRRLMVFSPPRSGKSEIISRRGPAYILGRDPDASIIACSHTADLASTMNRDVQRIMDDPAYLRLFPDTRLFGKNIRTLARGTYLRNSEVFEVINHAGVYKSAGVGGSIVGRGFVYGFIDDPIKSAEQAMSATYREKVWEWFNQDFYTRQAPDARIVLTLTRWHQDDLAGRLLKQQEENPNADRWTVLSFPAIAEPERGPEDPRAVGEALWPSRWNLDFLRSVRAQGEHNFAALYQQRPAPREGGLFKAAWFNRRVDVLPAGLRLIRYWDKAGTDAGGCYTCGVLMGRSKEGVYYVVDVVRGQWSMRERDQTMLATAHRDRARFPENEPLIFVEREGGSTGKDSVLMTASLFDGFPIHSDLPTGSKEIRAASFSGQCEAGNVILVRGKWNIAEYVDELCLFPNGRYADQADASSGSFNRLFQMARGTYVHGDLLCNATLDPDRYAAPDDKLTIGDLEIDFSEDERGGNEWWRQ